MHGTASRKVPNGKLIRVAVDYGDTYESVTITGDFFIEPPEALEALAVAVEGHPVDANHAELVTAIRGVDAQLIGFDADDLAAALRAAVGEADAGRDGDATDADASGGAVR
jgi:lipoate-protein ligase A